MCKGLDKVLHFCIPSSECKTKRPSGSTGRGSREYYCVNGGGMLGHRGVDVQRKGPRQLFRESVIETTVAADLAGESGCSWVATGRADRPPLCPSGSPKGAEVLGMGHIEAALDKAATPPPFVPHPLPLSFPCCGMCG